MTSYNVFASDVFTLMSKNEKLKLLKENYGWQPKNTKERTQEHLNIELRHRVNADFDVAITVRNNKTGESFLLADSMDILGGNHGKIENSVFVSMQRNDLLTDVQQYALSVDFSMIEALTESIICIKSEQAWSQCDDMRHVPASLNWVLAKQDDFVLLVQAESCGNERRFENHVPIAVGRFYTNIYKELTVSEILTVLTHVKNSMIRYVNHDSKASNKNIVLNAIDYAYIHFAKMFLE